ncbi:LacI family DNA-binding transcriptional regulator [Paenibacillus sp. UNC451MF]|uniref:LacI family DNA-binding transcriptional regulator n=1 Tax=Paenibacillus sp. UNC451MF TaxID=1449063 RepID=UPI000490F7F6|nr:LacI family DNA-binding transcriptional regulator [Paenibacillus sp. UNC451MF]
MKMEDIAKLANVSKSAVSIALNGKPGISSETRDKILKIVKDSGYIPRTMVKAGDVNSSITHTLRFVACTNSGIVLEHYYNQPFFMELIHDIEEQCRSRGYSLFFSSIQIDAFESTVQELENEHEAGGMILLGTNLTQEQIRLIAKKQPNLVVLDTCYETLNVHFIVMNNKMGAYQAGRHLLDLGHRRIGYVQSTSRMYNFDSRKSGFMTALREEGLELEQTLLFSASPTTFISQEELKGKFTELGDAMPTALFCECDYIAISVIKSLTELGIRVPEDISVVGFDNIRETMIVSPELTTVHVEKAKIAELAVSNLLNMIEGVNTVRTKSFIDTKLIIRKSSQAVE